MGLAFDEIAAAGSFEEQSALAEKLAEDGGFEFSQLNGSAGQCAKCGKHAKRAAGGKLSRCSGCGSAWYCCKECQKAHWKSGHKKVCAKLAKERPGAFEVTPGFDDLDADDFALPKGHIDPLTVASPWAKKAQCMGDVRKPSQARVNSIAYQPLSNCEFFASKFQGLPATRATRWAVGIDVGRHDLVGDILNQIHPLMCLFHAHAEQRTSEAASAASKTHRKGILLVESHGMQLQDLVGPHAVQGARPIAVHYLSTRGQLMYLEMFKKANPGADTKDIMSSFDNPLAEGKLTCLTAFSHNQGGICNANKRSGRRVGHRVLPKGAQCFAHTLMIMPQVFPASVDAAGAMEAMLGDAGLRAAQSLQVDLSSGEVMAVDFDQSNFLQFTQFLQDSDVLDDGEDQVRPTHMTFSLEKNRAAFDQAMDSIGKAVQGLSKDDGRVAKLETPKDAEERRSEPAGFKESYTEFMMHYLPLLGSFAAVSHSQIGKGVLFLLSRCCWDDLQQTADVGQHKSNDRQLLAVWGSVNSQHRLSVECLRRRCRHKTTTLESSIEKCEDFSEFFPLVLISDPSGRLLPSEVGQFCRQPKRNSASTQCVNVGLMRWIDYTGLLAAGTDSGVGANEVFCLNLDRDESEPID